MDLLGDIVEHDVESAEAPAPKPQNNGFPVAHKTHPSRWQQRLSEKGISSMSDSVKVDPNTVRAKAAEPDSDRHGSATRAASKKVEPVRETRRDRAAKREAATGSTRGSAKGSATGSSTATSEADQISEQNTQFIKNMSLSDKEEAKQELMQGMSSRALEILMKRSRRKYGATAGAISTASTTVRSVKRIPTVDDIVPTIEGPGTWIGGYTEGHGPTNGQDLMKDDELAQRKVSPDKVIPHSTEESLRIARQNAIRAAQALPPVEDDDEEDKPRKSKSPKRVRFSEAATVNYANEKKKSTEDEEWEDIEYLDDEGPTLEDAIEINEKPTKEVIGESKIKKPSEPYEKLDIDDPHFNEKLHEKYFADLPTNPKQLAWMSDNIPQVPKDVSYDSIDDVRFDFNGDIITGENIAKYSQNTVEGLHNHAAHPELPGYTLPELAQYLRSTFPGQRSIAARTLGRILYKLGTLRYSVTEVTNKDAQGPEKAKRKAEGEEGLFEQKCWEVVIGLGILDMLNASAAETEKNVSVRNYAVEALWLWNEAGGEEICKRVAKQMEEEASLYQV